MASFTCYLSLQIPIWSLFIFQLSYQLNNFGPLGKGISHLFVKQNILLEVLQCTVRIMMLWQVCVNIQGVFCWFILLLGQIWLKYSIVCVNLWLKVIWMKLSAKQMYRSSDVHQNKGRHSNPICFCWAKSIFLQLLGRATWSNMNHLMYALWFEG